MCRMIDEKFVLLGLLLNLWGSGTYAWNTLKGRTKPNRVTWFLWAVAPLIAFAAQWSDGVRWQSLMTFMVGFGPLIIFIASFMNRKAYWQVSRLDYVCGVISIVALAFWLATGKGVLAVVLSIIADVVAGIPTLLKAWKEPETEHPSVFRNGALSALITLLAVRDWTFVQYGFAFYILLICVALYSMIAFKIGPKLSGGIPSARQD